MMKAVQTLWCGGKSLLHDSFGWTSPAHHLMAWALSSSRLAEYYNQVELYTDSEGYDTLVKDLGLPYSDVHVVLDDAPFSTLHWSLSKVMTYSLQKEPFIHCDGDFFLFQQLPKNMAEAPLLAQNREYGTAYYKNGFMSMKNDKFILPKKFYKLIEKYVLPYNMGIFGGSDVDFIKEYANNVLDTCRSNDLFKHKYRYTNINYNAILEQAFFAFYAEIYHRDVSCFIPGEITDGAYSDERFWNLEKFHFYPFFHLLGGHKSVPEISKILEKLLFHLYPQLYEKIVYNLYETRNKIPETTKKNTYDCIKQYETFLYKCRSLIEPLSDIQLLRFDETCSNYKIKSENEELECCEYCSIMDVSKDFNNSSLQILKERLSCSNKQPLHYVAVSPTLREKGIIEFPIAEFDLRIITKLKEHVHLTFTQLFQIIQSTQKITNKEKISGLKKLLCDRLSFLIMHGAIRKKETLLKK